MTRNRFNILIALFFVLLPACSPVKGYSGPELPDNLVSFVGLSYDSDDIEVPRATAKGIEFGSNGINLLPGKQQLDLSVKVKEPPFNCVAYPTMDRSSYESCLEDYYKDLRDKDRKSSPRRCDCYDYLTVRERCDRRVHDGTCQIDFDSTAGNRYEIRISNVGQEAAVDVHQTGNYRSVGDGKCNTSGGHTETEDSYVGTGESTARSHGIYWCQ